MSVKIDKLNRAKYPKVNYSFSEATGWKGRIWEATKEGATTSLAFLTLYKPLSFPLAAGAAGMRVTVQAIALIDAIIEGDVREIFSELKKTTLNVICLATTIFAHPLGMLISAGYDLILELRALIQYIKNGQIEEALKSSLKIAGHALYFTLFLYGSLEITLAFLGAQVLAGVWEAHHAFKEANYITAIGHLLASGIRGNQIAGHYKPL